MVLGLVSPTRGPLEQLTALRTAIPKDESLMHCTIAMWDPKVAELARAIV